MTKDFDDESLQGSYTVIKTPKISPKTKPHFKEGKEYRFFEDSILRTKADEPIMKYLRDNNNEWTTARQFINKLRMAERTVFHMCRRLVLHEVLDFKVERVMDNDGHNRNTRLYRLTPNNRNDPSRD